MEDIIVVNEKKLESTKEKILSAGKNSFHVVSDFDRTLTKAFVNGKKVPSIIFELRNGQYLSLDYNKKSNTLADFYHPIELDPSISLDEKQKAMHEWWEKHFNLLIESGLEKKHIKQVIDSGKSQFREGALEFIDYLYENKIPLVIISSTGLGGDSIKLMLEKENRLYENVHIIANNFKWENGKAVGFEQPVIHVFNKKETTIETLPAYREIEERKNVLLLGDGLGDVDMVSNFKCENLIKAGFLNYDVEKNLKDFKSNFDVIILNDGTFNYINELTREISK